MSVLIGALSDHLHLDELVYLVLDELQPPLRLLVLLGGRVQALLSREAVGVAVPGEGSGEPVFGGVDV